MKRIIIHWTAGAYTVNALELRDYHFIIDGNGKVVQGIFPVSANEKIVIGKYAAHTRHCNTGSIGVSLSGMAGAIQGVTNGKYPLKKEQFEALSTLAASLCKQYNIPVTPSTVLTHTEVQGTLKIPQNGKWDIAVIPHLPMLKGAKECGDYIRKIIKEKM